MKYIYPLNAIHIDGRTELLHTPEDVEKLNQIHNGPTTSVNDLKMRC